MSALANALATKGVICKGGDRTIIRTTRCIIPFNLQLTKDLFNLNLKLQDTFKLNSIIDQKNLNLLKLSHKLNSKVSDLKLNLKKCED